MALVERAGEIVTKDELIARVWSDVRVEEGSLRVHLSALRKALGDGQFGNKYISNVQGRGYSFVAPVTRESDANDRELTSSRAFCLPPPLTRMVGRDDVVRDISDRLQTERLLTILGAGGIGKTTVAVAVAHAALADFPDAVFFVDLAAVKDSEQVTDAIATAVGLDHRFGGPEEALLKYLHNRKALIVLDSCEHLIEKTAEIADSIFQRAPRVFMLATSREALRTAGERIFPLHPLDCPPEQPGQTATQVLSYPAARLFVERVGARGQDFTLDDEEAPLVAELCRKLDGIALAIELAAGRAAVFGVRDTLARLGSRLDLLKFGRRTANPRHQTLRATLDWSHSHLSVVEQIVLRRVAIFVGHFTLEAALAVVVQEGVDQTEAADAVGSLVNKSLTAVRMDARGTQFRLLDITRAYALDKLAASGEHDVIAERHADYSIRLLEANSAHLSLDPSEAPAEAIRDCLGNVRAALEWSFSPSGRTDIAVRLAAAAAPLLLALSLLSECRSWMEKAIARTGAGREPRHQLDIRAALALSLMFTEGNSERVRDIFLTALTFAEQCDDAYQQLRVLGALSMYHHRILDADGTLELARRTEAVARKTGSPEDEAISHSLLGAALHLRGEHAPALKHLERSLRSTPRQRHFNASQYIFDRRTLSLICLTRSHWLTGNLDQAVRFAEWTAEEAERSANPIALSRAMVLTMPLYFWIDDLAQVERNLSILESIAEKYSMEPYRAVAGGLRGRYWIRLGRTHEGMQALRQGIETLKVLRYEMPVADFVADLVVSLAKEDTRAEALALVEQSIAAQTGLVKELFLPVLFVAEGLAHASGELPEMRSAELCFERAMAVAREQSALSFELRAGLELARIWFARGEFRQAHDLIDPIYSRFTEGFATPDLVAASTMLQQVNRAMAS